MDPVSGEPWDDVVVVRCGSHDTVAVLVRLSRLGEIDVDELREVLTEAWLAVAPRRLARQHFPDH